MQLAVQYSRAAADLLDVGRIDIDRFKCPAWQDLIATVREAYPVYVHFPLKVGLGIGDAIDAETNQTANWRRVEALLSRTDTPFVNVHLAPTARDHPDIPVDTAAVVHVERLTACLIRDVRAVVQRFGPERVIVENDHDNGGQHLRPAFLPEVIRHMVEETGCDLLLDVSHARLAAHALGMDARAYLHALPLGRVREIHLTGIQPFGDRWIDALRRANIDEDVIRRFAGRLMDHLPLTETDWEFTAWALEQIRRGVWGQPWIVALEYGGVGPLWEAVTDAEVLVDQVPRLRDLIKTPRV